MRFLPLFSVVSAFALEGCGCEAEFHAVSEKAKEWAPYAEGYYIPFETSSGKDTLDVISYEIEYSNDNSGKGDCGFREEQISIALVSGDVFDDTIRLQINGDVITVRNGTTARDHISIDLTYNGSEWASGWSVRKGVGNRHQSLEVDGVFFDDVVVAGCQRCGPLSEIVVSRYLGIVAYKVDGVYWTMSYDQ